jgi:hypothetical protein
LIAAQMQRDKHIKRQYLNDLEKAVDEKKNRRNYEKDLKKGEYEQLRNNELEN